MKDSALLWPTETHVLDVEPYSGALTKNVAKLCLACPTLALFAFYYRPFLTLQIIQHEGTHFVLELIKCKYAFSVL